MERISTIQAASVITQPTDAVEHLTLVEKLEQKASQYLQYKNDAKTLHDVRYFGGNANGFTEAINIVKQHNEWVSVGERLPTENDGRVSWGANAYKKYILVNIVSRGIAITCRFNLTDKCFETSDKVTHWMPLPKPPSEVQDD